MADSLQGLAAAADSMELTMEREDATAEEDGAPTRAGNAETTGRCVVSERGAGARRTHKEFGKKSAAFLWAFSNPILRGRTGGGRLAPI